jgi:hypothetical protein
MPAYDYDIVLLSDLRYPGGNSTSLAEEIKAQARAGYSTGLVHLRAPHMLRPRSFNRKIVGCLASGLAELVSASRPVRARALVIRQPRLFTEDLAEPLRVEADTTVMVVNHPPVDGLRGSGNPYYDLAAVRDRLTALLGEVQWAPIGPLVRRALLDRGVALNLRGDDWVNILDIDEWWVDRSRFRGDRPVIGRHSRDHESKWPSARSDILAAYPPDPGAEIKILGGADAAIRLLGRQPANWTVYPFGAMSPKRFLREVDFFVYYHHPGWIESFGRNVIEGMASGCPAVLPPHFEAVFGSSCEYVAADGARERVERLYRDPAAYRARSEGGREYVEQRFGAAQHVSRIRALIGEPSTGPAGMRPPKRPARRVMLASLESRGAGSIGRLLALAAGLGQLVEPVLLGPWPATRLAHGAGHICELLPDGELEAGGGEQLVARVRATAADHGAEAIVLDAHRSAVGARVATEVAPVPVVLTGPPPARAGSPSEPESSMSLQWDDVALGAQGRALSVPVRGIAGEALPAEAARAELALPPRGPLALLCAGADARALAPSRLLPAAQALLDRGWSVVVPELLVGEGELRLPPAVIRVTARPLWRYLCAFDVAVAASGYTLTHELLAAGVPSLLVSFGDRLGEAERAVGARDRGLALGLERFAEAPFAAAIAELGDARTRGRLAAACQALDLRDGAARLAAALGLSGEPAASKRLHARASRGG